MERRVDLDFEIELLTDFETSVEVVVLLLDEHAARLNKDKAVAPNNKNFFINTPIYKILLEIIFAISETFA